MRTQKNQTYNEKGLRWLTTVSVRIGRRTTERRGALDIVLAGLFFGGLARVVSVIAVGWPHQLFIGLGIAELIVPPAVFFMSQRFLPKAVL